jgi:ABC-type transport system involved in cytochrome c biogenesis permease subunit
LQVGGFLELVGDAVKPQHLKLSKSIRRDEVPQVGGTRLGLKSQLSLLIGGLGICFVSQRCVEDFSTPRLHSIARVSLVLGSVALFLTTLGVLLAMIWAKIEWGRYWAWDSKEIGGLSVVVWLACYLVAHRFFKSSERGVLAISMLGNIVVSLAWFGPQVNGFHQHGTPLLTIAVLVNLSFFAIGLVPAGRLRWRND